MTRNRSSPAYRYRVKDSPGSQYIPEEPYDVPIKESVTETGEKYVEWSVEDLSAFMDTNVKGKPIAQAQQAINEKFGTLEGKWETSTG